MQCACLVSLDKPDLVPVVQCKLRITGNPYVMNGGLFYWGGTTTVGTATTLSMVKARTPPIFIETPDFPVCE